MNLSAKEKILALGCVVALLIAGAIAAKVTQFTSEKPDYSNKELESLHQSALSKIFGAFRVGVSDLIWLKTDEYLHQGVSYIHKPPGEHSHEHEDSHEHVHEHEKAHPKDAQVDSYTIEKAMGWDVGCANAYTAIPSAEKDFRGLLGDLERVAKPYVDHHIEHARMEELIPWYRILTSVNPHHVRGYIMGGYIISSKAKNNQEALKFLKEGERNNPDSPEIKEALGRLYFFRMHDQEASQKYFLEAENLYLAKPNLTEDDKETLTNAYRIMAWIYGEEKQLKEMARVVEAGLRLYPEDLPLLKSKKKLEQLKRSSNLNSPKTN